MASTSGDIRSRQIACSEIHASTVATHIVVFHTGQGKMRQYWHYEKRTIQVLTTAECGLAYFGQVLSKSDLTIQLRYRLLDAVLAAVPCNGITPLLFYHGG